MSIFINLSLVLFIAYESKCQFQYGQHFPNGLAAVNYIYGPNGTWKAFNPLQYVWNYYAHFATENHPYNFDALLGAANGSAFYTARDANGYLLCDSNHDLEINPEYCSDEGADLASAFHEHNGIKAQGIRSGAPFTQFWLDDNWLARYMSQTYQRKEPRGLVDQNGFLRWRVIGGDTTSWKPYTIEFFDTLALSGLYYLALDNIPKSLEQWRRSLELSGAVWNNVSLSFEYPNVHENYHLGLWKILTAMLQDNPEIPPATNAELLQHSVSLSTVILKNQEIDIETGDLIGWLSNIGSTTDLINTESVSCCVLGLGANAKFVFQVQEQNDKNEDFTIFFNSKDISHLKTKGPRFPLGEGLYRAEFVLRLRNNGDFHNSKFPQFFGNISVMSFDNNLNSSEMKILATKALAADDFQNSTTDMKWTKIGLDFSAIENLNGNIKYDFVLEYDSTHYYLDFTSVIVK